MESLTTELVRKQKLALDELKYYTIRSIDYQNQLEEVQDQVGNKSTKKETIKYLIEQKKNMDRMIIYATRDIEQYNKLINEQSLDSSDIEVLTDKEFNKLTFKNQLTKIFHNVKGE